MARLVVLRFELDEEAESFAKTMQGGWQLILLGRDQPTQVTLEMMVQTPTLFCECGPDKEGWRRGEKRGWWIHAKCGRPSVGWGQNARAVIGEAVDILEKPSRNTDERLQHIPEEGVSGYDGNEFGFSDRDDFGDR